MLLIGTVLKLSLLSFLILGGSFTKADEQQFVAELFSRAQTHGLFPDIGIDTSLAKYSELNSASEVVDYSKKLGSELRDHAPEQVKNLGAALASLSGVPNAVGLGALVISLIMDMSVKTFTSTKKDSTLNMVRRVFAEEKASGVRDSMDEYMKRLTMHMRKPSKVLEETLDHEKKLSDKLTILRNSMLHDNQMSSRAMRYWGNGAAFHAQMLIHAARLKMVENSWNNVDALEAPVRAVVDLYLKDLDDQLKKYKSYKHSTITISRNTYCAGMYMTMSCDHTCEVNENELGKKSVTNVKHFPNRNYAYSNCNYCLNAYINYMFEQWSVLKELEAYFTCLKSNIRTLILQSESFSL